MRRILIINPNTSSSVSALLQTHAQAAAGAAVAVDVVTARFGAPYIACEASYAVAGHASLDAFAAAHERGAGQPKAMFDAVLIGCFGDPGLFALRDVSEVPVTGLAAAAFAEAAQHGRFAIVTGGRRWKPMLERLVDSLGYAAALGGIATVAPSGAQLAQDPLAARALLADACLQAMRSFNAKAVILGGAGLAGMAAHVEEQIRGQIKAEAAQDSVPVIDSVLAGVRQAVLLAAQPRLSGNGRLGEVNAWLGRR
jgi:allantoin racemase